MDPMPMLAIIDWAADKLAEIETLIQIGDGLLTYEGDATRLVNQCWKDSPGSMVDGVGHLLDPPIAVVEAQGYAQGAPSARRFSAMKCHPSSKSETDHGRCSRSTEPFGYQTRTNGTISRIATR